MEKEKLNQDLEEHLPQDAEKPLSMGLKEGAAVDSEKRAALDLEKDAAVDSEKHTTVDLEKDATVDLKKHAAMELKESLEIDAKKKEKDLLEGHWDNQQKEGQQEPGTQAEVNPQAEMPRPAAASGYGTWPVYLNGQQGASVQGMPYAGANAGGNAAQNRTQDLAGNLVQNAGPRPAPNQIPVRQKVLNAYERKMKDEFGRYGFCALFIGVLAAFCFYRNPHAVTYPLFIGAVYLMAYRVLPSLGLPIKKDSLFLAAAALILAMNSAVTASSTLHHLNTIAQLLLGSIFLIHQGYADRHWDIEKYMTSIVLLWFEALAALPRPFSYTAELLKKVKQGKSRNILLLLGGCAAGIPVVVYLGYLLADADVVFKMIMEDFVLAFFRPSTIFSIFLMIVCTALTVCCLLGSLCSMSLPEVKETKRHNPLAAISFTAMIAVLYLLFCGIQVVYLFAGKGKLPAEMTYSEYARQGFFQLLAVAVLNFIFVLNCFKYFCKHRILTFLLTVISLCTYIMIASAAYRMLLYVGAYYLTFLRLFVLWFLGVLAILMLGVLADIFLPHFPLFRWCLTVITLAYCGFAWCLPDYQIARYNIAQEGGWITLDNVEYFIDCLSADAAPVLAKAPLSPEVTYGEVYYCGEMPVGQAPVDKIILISDLEGIPWYFRSPSSNRLTSVEEQIEENLAAAREWQPGIRSYNFSEARAKRMVEFGILE